MPIILYRRRLLALALAAPFFATAALAHHGWSWTDEDFFELKGTVTAVYVGNPHATLDLDSDGEVWRVEMAPPARTIAAGVTEESVRRGDRVTAIGHRSRDHAERRMKAVRIVVGDKTYDVYPGLVPPV